MGTESQATSADNRRQFKLTRRVGVGGFGEVYLAEMSTHTGFAKTVALKLLKKDVEGASENATRMRDEAKMLGMLRHRSIVQADDLISIDGRIAVVMEYIPGATLSDILNPKRFPHPFPVQVGLRVIAEMADAMEAAWSRPSALTGEPLQVLHRDIKPANVRLTPDGEVKILDFGIARADKMDREASTRSFAIGSLHYMAPELLVGHTATPSSDIYALGVTFFEILARSRHGMARDTAEDHESRLKDRFDKLELADVEDSREDVFELLQTMLAFDPERRPNAKQVAKTARALERALDGGSLLDWAPEWIGKVVSGEEQEAQVEDDENLTGEILFEEVTHSEIFPPKSGETWDDSTLALSSSELREASDALGGSTAGSSGGKMGLVAGLVVLLLLGGGGVAVWKAGFLGGAPPATSAQSDAGPSADPAPNPDPAPDPDPVSDPAPVPEDPPAESATDAVVAVDSEAIAEAEPSVTEPAATEDPKPAATESKSPATSTSGSTASSPPPKASAAGTLVSVKLKSEPREASILVDGQTASGCANPTAKTPNKCSIATGTHTLTLSLPDGRTASQTITVTENGTNSWKYDFEIQSW